MIALGGRRDQRVLKILHTIKCVRLVLRHQPAVADDIGDEHRKQPALFGRMAYTVL